MKTRCSVPRFAAGCLAFAALCVLAGCPDFARGVVPSESGFDGAVTVVSEKEDGACGVVTVRVPYLGVRGDAKTGLARVVFPRAAVLPGVRTPAFCHVHYEKDVGGAKHWAEKGWVVFSAAYTAADGESPIDVSVGNGNNLARAVIQWARRVPFVDRSRLHIDGGSQGGYMALEMSADMFPVTSATADAPVVNWDYNFNYIAANGALAGYPDQAAVAAGPMPVLGMVATLADQGFNYFTKDFADETWYRLSPVSYADRIANPTMVTCATGDMLVPMEAMTRTTLRPVDLSRFPKGYTRDFDALTPNEHARTVFEDALPKDQVFVHVEPKQDKSFVVTTEMMRDSKKQPADKPANIDRAFSKDKQWTLFYMDEGGPEPFAGHTTWYWATNPDKFVAYYRDAKPAVSILNAAKMKRIMERHAGRLSDLPTLNDGKPANRLNYAAVEQRDVETALRDYAALGPEYAENVKALYAACPVKPFGDTLSAAVLN
jgi:hypothetical protein